MHTTKLQSRKTKQCALCHRALKEESKELPLIGTVGPKCYSEFAALNEVLEIVEDARYYMVKASQVASKLRKLGLKVRIRNAGTDERAFDVYCIEVIGVANQTSKATQKYGKTYKQHRKDFANALRMKSQERRAAA